MRAEASLHRINGPPAQIVQEHGGIGDAAREQMQSAVSAVIGVERSGLVVATAPKLYFLHREVILLVKREQFRADGA